MRKLKWCFPYIREIKLLYVLSVCLIIAEAVSLIGTVALQQKLIDDIFVPGRFEELNAALLSFGLVFLCYGVLFTVSPHVMHLNVAHVRRKLTRDVLRHISRLPVQKLEQERTTRFVHYLTQDADLVAWTIAGTMPASVGRVITVVVLGIFVGMASLSLLLFVIVVSLLYFVISKNFIPKVKAAAKDVQEKKADLLIHIEEGISSTREVVAFHRFRWERRKYDTLFQSLFTSVMKESRLLNKQTVTSEPLKWGANLACLAYGGYLVMQGDVSLGLFVVAFQFTSQLMDAFQLLFQFVMELSRRFGYVERMQELLDMGQVLDGERALEETVKDLRFQDVSFAYSNERQVLKNFSAHIPTKQKLAFVGGSGCGKSTVAKMLLRFIDPTTGDILVNGIPLQEIQREGWMEKVGIVFQEPYLFPDTIRANLLLGREDVDDERLMEVCGQAQIHQVIMDLPKGYDTVIGERGITLSGGQRQRLAIARALLQDPDILILDEATAALDLETERRIQRNIDQLRKGKTTIVIAHRLSTVQNADCIFVMDEGSVVESGTHEELLQIGNLYPMLVSNQVETIA